MFQSHIIGLLLLILIRLEFNCAFNVETVNLELLDDKFRVSIPNDPDIKWVAYNVNINKEFRSFEAGQLAGLASRPTQGRWSHEFQRSLEDTDLVYIWLAIQYNKVIFRDKQGPISIGAIRTGDPNFVISKSSSTTTTTTTASPPIEVVTTRLGSTGKQPDISNKACFASITEVQSTNNKHCKGDIIFEENFDHLSPERWTNEVRIPFTADDAEFVVYNGTANVESGILKIPASLFSGSLTRGTIDLGGRYVWICCLICAAIYIDTCSI